MTTDQAQLLNDTLANIQARLNLIDIPVATTNDAQANLVIAETRMKLSHIDQQLFECYRLMEKFHDSNRPHLVVHKHTPSIDDLEI